MFVEKGILEVPPTVGKMSLEPVVMSPIATVLIIHGHPTTNFNKNISSSPLYKPFPTFIQKAAAPKTGVE